MPTTVGVLALQGGFREHLSLLSKASHMLLASSGSARTDYSFIEVRTSAELARCDALIIPGGESTTMSLVAAQTDLLDRLRDFVKVQKKPVWGTCAGLILLSDAANATKKGGQELIGGLPVRVHRNHFGRQTESFEADMTLPFLQGPPTTTASEEEDGKNGAGADAGTESDRPFRCVFIRAPVVEEVLDTQTVQVLAKLPGRLDRAVPGVSQARTKDGSGDIVAVRCGNVLGTSFHPELTDDARIHSWWLRTLVA
ncbi:5'-phosphate synthase pdxT subunit [Geosmithia morbida]|uniref:glutaminase n=1 Tax=Geosmithia morbida TaxID=1094350 RepID=A0A9P5D7U5_9HYPO|nr:5'-phosphate synthase pdxT subunit [Geosmithia morbida]KAF4126991.1 5'-phosphate synthase pdxT subunit [Geosmithia morbida]